jgi:EAL domain-containing protein (putative c-di-GMP-specific phosphodiesterase class I)
VLNTLLGFSHEIEQDGMEIKLIRAIFEKPFAIDEFELEVTASLGVVNRTAAMSVEETISAVDLATREGKKGGLKGSLFFYNTTLKKEMEDKLAITSYLKQSILDENFVVLYQPQVDTVSNDVGGYEALVRLEGDAYYPGQFIPVAEQSGMVIEVDRIVTKKVVQQLATWKKRHKRLRPVSINYSAVQLKDEGYVDFLIDLLKRYDVAPNLIKIEITESLLLGSEEQTDQLFSRLKSAGIAMALDDFGTGYTSLSRVTTIPADVVKIDKSLVDAYMVPGKERFLDDLTRLVHGLKKKIIVEGVETKEQLEICRELGCDMVQGYYFSKPLLPERAAQFEPKKD